MRFAHLGLLLFLGAYPPAEGSEPARKVDRFGLTELHETLHQY